MATVVHLPEDQSFASGRVGAPVGRLVGEMVRDRREREEERKKVEAVQQSMQRYRSQIEPLGREFDQAVAAGDFQRAEEIKREAASVQLDWPIGVEVDTESMAGHQKMRRDLLNDRFNEETLAVKAANRKAEQEKLEAEAKAKTASAGLDEAKTAQVKQEVERERRGLPRKVPDPDSGSEGRSAENASRRINEGIREGLTEELQNEGIRDEVLNPAMDFYDEMIANGISGEQARTAAKKKARAQEKELVDADKQAAEEERIRKENEPSALDNLINFFRGESDKARTAPPTGEVPSAPSDVPAVPEAATRRYTTQSGKSVQVPIPLTKPANKAALVKHLMDQGLTDAAEIQTIVNEIERARLP